MDQKPRTWLFQTKGNKRKVSLEIAVLTTTRTNIEITRDLVKALCDPTRYHHDVAAIQVIETHISFVILTGSFVYKIKKPVDLGFADFSTLNKRKFYCEEEIRLNRRLAAPLYLGVVIITGTPTRPIMNGSGKVIEYAVKMRQFEQNRQLNRYLKQHELTPQQIDQFATDIAAFHKRLAPAEYSSRFAAYESIAREAMDNFTSCEACDDATFHLYRLRKVKLWTQQSLERNKSFFEQRKHGGFIRECHGDLHLGNLALLDNRIVAFDCLEFNAELRWVDTMNEIAFFMMDLDYHHRLQQGRRFLNKYLENTGDYEGVRILRFYLTYRAMVRAKVARIKLQQINTDNELKDSLHLEFGRHIDLATAYTDSRAHTPVVITHGFSGCGKTYLTGELVENADVIRIRSDIERKRLVGLQAMQRSHSDIARGLYTDKMNDEVYLRLHQLAGTIVKAGYPVIVDATFLRHDDRNLFQRLAKHLAVPFVILDITASGNTLERRINQRNQSQSDTSEATLNVLTYQQSYAESLTAQERAHRVYVDSETIINPTTLWAGIEAACNGQG